MAGISEDSGSVESARSCAFHTVWYGVQSWLSLSTGFASLASGCFVAGLLRCWLLSLVQAWEGEIRYLVIVVAPRKVCFFNRR